MPNRIIKESVCTSDNVDSLSAESERFFYRLMVQCDDFGRMDARVPVLRARCYPLKLDTVTEDHIRAWLNELVDANLIRLYNGDDNRPYLYFVTWERHQQVRAKRSKYPTPKAAVINNSDMISNDINGYQSPAYVPENPIQSNTNTNPTQDNVFVVFENEIGIITKSISEALIEAEKDYSPGWIIDAIKAAAKANKRSMSYVEGILRNWKAEGRNPVTSKQNGKPKKYEQIIVNGELQFVEVEE